MRYRLTRLRDGAGDSGPMSQTIEWDDDEKATICENARPKIGASMIVGSYMASYLWQDWWMTTPVTEIIEETENYCRFKTQNSEYEWTRDE
jgi:hypothetical protein